MPEPFTTEMEEGQIRICVVRIYTHGIKQFRIALKKRRFKTDLVSLKIACLRQSKDGEQHAGLVRARPTTDAVWIQRTKCTKVLIKIGHLWDLRQR